MIKKIALLLISFSVSIFSFAQKLDKDAIQKTLNSYKAKIEKLDTTGIVALFVTDSRIIEQGKDEGTIGHYLEHHLGPELKDFKAFTFSNYKVDVNVIGNYAYAVESYSYTIKLKDDKEIKSVGLATSVLQKVNKTWKIVQSHSSFRRAK